MMNGEVVAEVIVGIEVVLRGIRSWEVIGKGGGRYSLHSTFRL